ncbi:MAG TPA: hypothetical protein PKA44_09300 [Saprospiraceae bacterium]|nr:hypothetical protein [Saprospiraceae bacterium]
MKLSRLKELRPDVWEEARRNTVREVSEEYWAKYVINDGSLKNLFYWCDSEQGELVWQAIEVAEDFTLYDEWLSSQTKQPEPESKKDLDYWRYQFAGMAMQGFASNNAFCKGVPDGQIDVYFEIVVKSSLDVADRLIKELQKEKP